MTQQQIIRKGTYSHVFTVIKVSSKDTRATFLAQMHSVKKKHFMVQTPKLATGDAKLRLCVGVAQNADFTALVWCGPKCRFHCVSSEPSAHFSQKRWSHPGPSRCVPLARCPLPTPLTTTFLLLSSPSLRSTTCPTRHLPPLPCPLPPHSF